MKLWQILVKLVAFFNRRAAEELEARFQLPLLQQNNAEAKQALAEATKQLAVLMTERDAIAREVESYERRVTENLGYARSAKEQGNTELMNKAAQLVADIRNKMAAKQGVLSELNQQIDQLNADIVKMKADADKVETATQVVAAKAKVQVVQDKLHGKAGEANNAVTSSANMLAQIQDRQQRTDDLRKNARALSQAGTEDELHAALEAAGIKKSDQVSAADVLAGL